MIAPLAQQFYHTETHPQKRVEKKKKKKRTNEKPSKGTRNTTAALVFRFTCKNAHTKLVKHDGKYNKSSYSNDHINQNQYQVDNSASNSIKVTTKIYSYFCL